MSYKFDIPFVSNRGNACALACYTMVAKYFFPEATFEQISTVSNWRPPYVIWGFKFRNWMLEQDFQVRHIENLDYRVWGEEGAAGLKRVVPAVEFEFYKENTFDLEAFSKDIHKMFTYESFIFEKRKPTWEDVQSAYENDEVCTLVIDCAILDSVEGERWPHAIVILDVTNDVVTFHDPRGKENEKPYRKEAVTHLRKSFEDMDGTELVTYKRQ